ncbi:MAG: dihydrofolate reductase [Candidatus Gracilibacteria bacterium]
MKKFSIILAVDNENGIGKNNDLAWKINADIKYFKETTTKTTDIGKVNAVIMGRKTWESIPSKYKPLPDRINCIISSTLKQESSNSKIDDFVLYYNSLDNALEELEKKDNIENIFIIGGARLYNEALKHPNLDKIYLTEVDGVFDCDTFVNLDLENFEIESKGTIHEENSLRYRFMVYKRQKSSN